eukprot:bmy_13643T0
MREGGPGFGKMRRRGMGHRPKRREPGLCGRRRAESRAPLALSACRPQPCHRRAPERDSSGTSSPLAGPSHPPASSRPVPSALPAQRLPAFEFVSGRQ